MPSGIVRMWGDSLLVQPTPARRLNEHLEARFADDCVRYAELYPFETETPEGKVYLLCIATNIHFVAMGMLGMSSEASWAYLNVVHAHSRHIWA